MSKPLELIRNENTVPSHWINGDLRIGRLSGQLDAIIGKVRPLFSEWMQAEEKFEKNTVALAQAVRKAFELYEKTEGATRVGFARLFDPEIPEDAKTRDLAGNATYNRLNYLIDKVAKRDDNGEAEEEETPRLTVTERRKKIRRDWLAFMRAHRNKDITVDAVENLLRTVLGELWPEEVVDELVA